jgi:hypothetical protein
MGIKITEWNYLYLRAEAITDGDVCSNITASIVKDKHLLYYCRSTRIMINTGKGV